MKSKEYKWTPVPKIKTTSPIISIKENFWYTEKTFSAISWENIIILPWKDIKYVNIRAIAGADMSIWDAVVNSFRISQGSIKITWWLWASFSSSSNVISAWGNTAKVTKFRGNGIILNFSAVSWTITLQITSY